MQWHYVLLLFALFVLPKMLQRFRLPSAVTSAALGALAGGFYGIFEDDQTVQLLSTFGIVSLFLFAGLEVDFHELRRKAAVLAQHLAVRALLITGTTFAVLAYLDLAVQPAILVALALTTPSTGFILDSLAALGLTEPERSWIKSKAIATEFVALGVLFVAVQPMDARQVAESTFTLGAMIVLLPMAFRFFAAAVLPYAPKSEFAFLLMAAVLCAVATRELGVYYLVGAFVVGLTAQRFRQRMPAIASENMVRAVEFFASLFVPFYFFHAGLSLRREDFPLEAVLLGLGFLAVMTPVRIGLVALHRRLALGEPLRTGARIGTSMIPTLVFTLVIAEILRDQFHVGQPVFGALIVYTMANSLIPGFTLRLPPQQLEALHVPAVPMGPPRPAAPPPPPPPPQ